MRDKKIIDYRRNHSNIADDNVIETRAKTGCLRVTAAVVAICLVMSFIGYICVKIAYPYRSTEIKCFDSATGKLLKPQCEVQQTGDKDGDWFATWGVGGGGDGSTDKLICTRNVWMNLRVTAPGYSSVTLYLSRNTPDVVVVKLQKLKA